MGRRLVNTVVLLLLLPLAAAANDLAAMGSSSRAHACCAKTKYACAGMKSADDCCKRMGHSTAQPTPATVTAGQAFDTHATIPIAIVDIPVLAQTPIHETASHAIKRPHDPPHLHAFTLLI